MSYGPKGSEAQPASQCTVCGHQADLIQLPGINGKYCWECSADVATSILLKTEIEAAANSGQRPEDLVAELAHLSRRLLERAQSA